MRHMSEGIERIAKERQRQVEKEGYLADADDEHDGGQLALAAACYASPERLYVQREFAAGVSFVDPFPDHWPDKRAFNGNVLKDPTDVQWLRLLEKAGALIAAEIDRLLRKGSASMDDENEQQPACTCPFADCEVHGDTAVEVNLSAPSEGEE